MSLTAAAFIWSAPQAIAPTFQHDWDSNPNDPLKIIKQGNLVTLVGSILKPTNVISSQRVICDLPAAVHPNRTVYPGIQNRVQQNNWRSNIRYRILNNQLRMEGANSRQRVQAAYVSFSYYLEGV